MTFSQGRGSHGGIRLSPTDPSSFSNPEYLSVENFKIRWKVDFEKKVLTGSVTYDVIRTDPSVNYIIFDTKDLYIKSVHWPIDGRGLQHTLGAPVSPFGRPLTIILPEFDEKQKTSILIDYETSPLATGLHWLRPDQTETKKFPFLFSEAQPIHARSFLPCQDTPAVKCTFSAEVIAAKVYTVLMSGIRLNNPELINGSERRHKFRQNTPIPSYLVAVVIGRIGAAQIGPRTTIWAEDEFLDQAAIDFEETEEMLQTAEGLVGEYAFQVFDLLVLPRCFPFNGMENPCLNYISSTLLTGDKAFALAITHEIAHCWTGNLVTSKTFEHFWLNEGFTAYLMRLIAGRLKGEEYRQFLNIEGWDNLHDSVAQLGENHPFTSLVWDLTGVNPDEVIQSGNISDEKGCAFLNYLEELVGRDQFEAFIIKYLRQNRFKSIDTDAFKDQFNEYFKKHSTQGKGIAGINWEKWLKATGMPPYQPHFDRSFIKECDELADRWKAWDPARTPSCPFSKKDLLKFNIPAPQIKEFLDELFHDEESNMTVEKLKAMQTVYDFDSTNNFEIKCLWIRLGIRAKWKDQVPVALKFIEEQGRLKFIRPIYKDLLAWEEVSQKAIEAFSKTRADLMVAAVTREKKSLG